MTRLLPGGGDVERCGRQVGSVQVWSVRAEDGWKRVEETPAGGEATQLHTSPNPHTLSIPATEPFKSL